MSSSKATTAALAAGMGFVAGAPAADTGPDRPRTSDRERREVRIISDALGRLEGDVPGFLAAPDRQLDAAAAGHLAGQADDVGDVGDRAALDMGDHVAGLKAGAAGRSFVQHGLDAGILVG